MMKHRGRDRQGMGEEEGNSLCAKAEVEDRLTDTTHWVAVLMGCETQERALGVVILESI